MNASSLKFLLLFAVSLALLSGFANASGCGTLPSGISSLITACIPVNVLNLQSAATPSGFQQQLSNLPINALAGNFVVYNSLSGSLMPTWVESNSMAWIYLGTNTIGATSNAIDVYYIGLGSSGTNFFISGNDIGEAPQLSSTYAQYDNGASVFPTLYQNFAGTSQPTGWTSSGVTFNNGVSVPASAWVATTSTFPFSGNVVDVYGYVASGTAATYMSASGFVPQAVLSTTSVFAGWGGGSSGPSPVQNAGSGATGGSTTVDATAVWTTMVTSTEGIYLENYAGQQTITADLPTGSQYVGVSQTGSQPTDTINWMRIRAYPPAGVMPTVQYGSPQSPSTFSFSITPNPAPYGTQVQITTTASPSTDGVNVIFQGSTVATGTGSVTYNALGTPIAMSNALVPGTYTVNGCDTTLNTCAGNTILTINKATPTNTLTSCSSSTLPFTCTTTATISTLGNQEQISLYLGSNLIGSNVLSVSDTENTLGYYSYTANSPGNGNYLPTSLTASFYGYIPLVFQNITGSALNTRSIAYPQNTIFSTYYPILFSASAYNGVTYDLTQSFDYGANVAITTGASSLSYVPPANQATGNVLLVVTEHQYANSITIGANVNLLNMLDMNGQLSFLGNCADVFQYYPNCAEFPLAANVFTVSPTSWMIPSDFPGNQHSNQTGSNFNVIQFSNANLTIPLNDLVLTYGQFTPPIAFPINAINNPLMQTSITQTKGCGTSFFAFGNTVPSSPCTREITNITNYDEQFRKLLYANTTIFATYGFNNYSIVNTSVFSGNNIQLYIASSAYQNPTITQSTPSVISAATGHYDAINTFCSQNINSGTYRNFNIYSVNTNGSLYTFTVYEGYNPVPSGTFMQVLGGISPQSSVSMQSFKINSNPYSVPLQNGQPYAFKFFNCTKSIYETNFSVWGNPITLYLPQNFTGPTYKLPALNATCGEHPYVGNTLKIVCNGTDAASFTNAWKVRLWNVTTLLSSTLLSSQLIHGSSFTFTYEPVSPTAEYQVVAVAEVGNVIDPQYTVLSWFSTQTLAFLPQVVANGWIALLMILSAIAIGSRSPVMSLLFEVIILFLLPTMNVLPIPVSIVYEMIALAALAIFVMAKKVIYG